MEKILQQIEEKYADNLAQAELALSTATLVRNNLVGSMEEEKRKVREYFTAVAQKEQAEMIIASTDPTLKASVVALSTSSEEIIMK